MGSPGVDPTGVQERNSCKPSITIKPLEALERQTSSILYFFFGSVRRVGFISGQCAALESPSFHLSRGGSALNLVLAYQSRKLQTDHQTETEPRVSS